MISFKFMMMYFAKYREHHHTLAR